MKLTRRILAAGTALVLVLTACGGSDSSDDETTDDTAVTTDAPTTSTDEVFTESTDDVPAGTTSADTTPPESAAPETSPPETNPPETEPPATEQGGGDSAPGNDGDIGAPAEGVAASLIEWAIEAPTEYVAGDVTFTATNNGSFPHELVVIQGESYESLPLTEAGAVIEDDLPTGALLGRTGRISGGSSEQLTVTLVPGNYVLVCNLGTEGSSHAGRGQRLDITVS